MIIDKFGKKFESAFLSLPVHIKEQVTYRRSLCLDCEAQGKCQSCGCSVPGKWFADEACTGQRYPDMFLDPKDWDQYKKDNGIKIEFEDKI